MNSGNKTIHISYTDSLDPQMLALFALFVIFSWSEDLSLGSVRSTIVRKSRMGQ